MRSAIRRFPPMIALVAVILAGCATTKEPVVSRELHAKNVESFERVWGVVNKTYWDPTFGGVDWQGVHDELRPRIEAARTMAAARSVMREMIGRLGKSHFGIIPAEMAEELDPGRGAMAGVTGIDVRVIDGHAFVTRVERGSPADLAGVRKGWEIVTIDGIDVRSKLREIAGEIEDTPMKPAILTIAIAMELRGPLGDPVAIGLIADGETRVVLEISRVEERGEVVVLGDLPKAKVHIDVERLDPNIGYIAFNLFVHPSYVMTAYNAAMTSFLDADGIVIDLRGNGGGLYPLLTGMAGWLVSERRNAGRLMLRGTELALIVEPRATHYDGPVAVIVDELCGSAAEAFPAILQEIGRAQIVGTRTMGAVLGASFEPLPNGDQLMYAAVNFETKSRGSLEGVGVIPDVEVRDTRESLLAGRDLPLEAAIRWIRDQHDITTNKGESK